MSANPGSFTARARHLLRDAAGDLLALMRLTEPRRFARGKLSILTFHRVLPEQLRAAYPLPGLAVTPLELDFILGTLASHYTMGTLAALAVRHLAGERPGKPFLALTFDDGQRDNLDYAVPVLRAHGVCATFFAVTDAATSNQALWHDRLGFAFNALDAGAVRALDYAMLGFASGAAPNLEAVAAAAKTVRPQVREAFIAAVEQHAGGNVRPSWDGLMTWDALRTLQAEGHEIGSHTRTHPILTASTDDELVDEVAGSRRIIEEHLGTPVVSFCYPNGDHDARVIAAVKSAGYTYAATTRAGMNEGVAARLTMKRFDMQSCFIRRTSGTLAPEPLLLRLANYVGRS